MIRSPSRPRTLVVTLAVAAILALAGLGTVLAYDDDVQYPSYSGCQTELFARADVSGSDEVIESYNWDYGSCAFNVAAKTVWFKNGGLTEAPWNIHPTYAARGSYVFGGYVYSYGKAQIERTSGNWSGFFYTGALFP